MDKAALISVVIDHLEADLDHATEAALESAESATDDEARSESKYDTRGLETSYLAAGQARHALELKESIAALRAFEIPEFQSASPIALGAIVSTLSSRGRESFFVLPGAGGIELDTDEGPLTVITSQSPLGHELIGKRSGDRVQAGGGKTILKVS